MALRQEADVRARLHHPDTLRPEAHPPHSASRARAGIDTGAARRPIVDFDAYEQSLKARMDPTANILRSINTRARAKQARMIFAEGRRDSRVLRASRCLRLRAGMGEAVVVGREDDVRAKACCGRDRGCAPARSRSSTPPIPSTSKPTRRSSMTGSSATGHDAQDVHRLAARDRHVFSALMLAHGHGDALVTGATRKSAPRTRTHQPCLRCPRRGNGAVAVTAVLLKGPYRSHRRYPGARGGPTRKTLPTSPSMGADVCTHARPRPAMSPSCPFLGPSAIRGPRRAGKKMHKAPEVLDAMGVDFEYEGDMTVDVALNMTAMAAYPFSRLTAPANVLVVPARHSASISVKLLQEMAGATVIGPILTGVDRPIQICSTVSTVNDILNMAVLAASTLD